MEIIPRRLKDPAYRLYEMRLRHELTNAKPTLPRHIAVLCDGNRRWARDAGHADVSYGYRAGADRIAEMLRWCAEAGIEIPRRRDWARLIERSFARVHFSFGLVWNDPQRRTVAFGFYDSIRQSGLVLMASLVIKRGLERAAALFENDLPAETIADWKNKAGRIGENLHRLFDEGAGGFVGATKVGRGFDVWGNGLAWPLATAAQRKVIAASFVQHRDAIFAFGCTRQTPYPEGWPGTQSKSYQNRGFWATGTGFVLPALAEADPDFALRLVQDLVENIDTFKRHEFIDATGKPGGPEDFLGSLSMPLMGLRAILSGRPLLDYM